MITAIRQTTKILIFAVLFAVTSFVHPAAAADAIKVRIGWNPGSQPLFYIARADKLFEKVGLDPEFIRFNAAPPMFAAFRSGDLDVAYMGAPPAVIAVSQGLPVKIFFTEDDAARGERLVVRKDAGIASISDLKGKTVGVWRGTSAEFALRTALSRANLSEKDVKILDLDVTVMLPAFTKKEVDGIFVWDHWALKLEKAGGVKLINDLDVGIRMPVSWVGREAWLEDPKGASRVIKALSMAFDDVLSRDKERATAIVAEAMGVDLGFAAELIDREIFPTLESQIDPNGPLSIHPDAVAKNRGLAGELTSVAKFLNEKGRIPNVPHMEKAIDVRPIQGVVGK